MAPCGCSPASNPDRCVDNRMPQVSVALTVYAKASSVTISAQCAARTRQDFRSSAGTPTLTRIVHSDSLLFRTDIPIPQSSDAANAGLLHGKFRKGSPQRLGLIYCPKLLVATATESTGRHSLGKCPIDLVARLRSGRPRRLRLANASELDGRLPDCQWYDSLGRRAKPRYDFEVHYATSRDWLYRWWRNI